MKTIELDYNPYLIHTICTVNDERCPEEDIYNIIYSVQNFPIQCWLYKRGSWPGLMYKLEIISRGEELKVFFRGRAIDYKDFYEVFEKHKWKQKVQLYHKNAYENPVYSTEYDEMKAGLHRIWDREYPAMYKGMREIVNQVNELIILLEEPPEHLISIDSLKEEEARNILKRTSYGVILGENIMNCPEDLNFVLQAAQSMIRPADSIILSSGEQDIESIWPEKFLEMRDRIWLVGNKEGPDYETAKNTVIFKYSEPLIISKALQILRKTADKLIEIIKQQEELKKDISKLCSVLNAAASPDPEDEQEYNRMVECVDWINKRKNAIYELQQKINEIWNY